MIRVGGEEWWKEGKVGVWCRGIGGVAAVSSGATGAGGTFTIST